jgi:hypothetical protein
MNGGVQGGSFNGLHDPLTLSLWILSYGDTHNIEFVQCPSVTYRNNDNELRKLNFVA